MDPSWLAPLAKSLMSHAGRELAGPAVKGVNARVLGDPEQKALERSLQRSFAEVERVHGRRFADADINAGFWEHEGAEELAKVLVPGVEPSAARLAERAVDSLGPCRSEDERLDRVIVLRPVFKALLDGLADDVRREPALRTVLGLSDNAQTAQAASRLADHLGAGAASEDDRVAYLRWVVDQHRYLRTAGVVRKTTVQLPLTEVFVGLRAQVDRRPGDRARAWFEQERDKLTAHVEAGQLDQTGFEAAVDRLELQYGRKFHPDGEPDAGQVVPVLDAVRDTAQLLVLGDPGTGKTTLLRYLAVTHARALLDAAPAPGRAPLFPIFLRIGEYARQGYPGAGIGEFVAEHLRRSECRTPGLSDLLARQLDGGRCLVLLDGLDEITSAELRRGVVTAVANFVTAYARQGNRFVVTSRIAGYQTAPLPDPFQAVRLRDMDDATIGRFLDVYCREVERAETPDKSDPAILDAGVREATAIGQALVANAGVRRLAANPLLLTALVLVHRASGRLPHRRVEAYIEVCNALGRTWRGAQGVAEADLPDERILTRWLTELGSWLHEHRPEGAATKQELLEVLGPLWAKHHGSTWDPAVLQDADPLRTDAGLGVIEFVEKADTHTGLLVERAPGRYGFSHLTFEEYYTGRALAFRGSAADRITAIRSRLHDPRYDEPILLALGLIGTDYAEQIDDVIAQAIYPAPGNPSAYEELLGRDFLFMLKVLADDIPLEKTATIDTIVNEAIDEYLNPGTSRCRFSAYRTSLLQRLASLGATKAGERFTAALDTRVATLSHSQLAPWCQLATTASQLGPLTPATITTLVQVATEDADTAVRVQAAAALVEGESMTKPVIAALVQAATGDADQHVRMRAVEALANGGSPTGPALNALVQVAIGDAHQHVRMRAAAALANGGSPTGPALNALIQVATGDAHSALRVNAAAALARGRSLPEPVITALVQLTTSATDQDVRLRAAATLAEGESMTEPVITALVQVATGDAHPAVRVGAAAALTEGGPLTEPVLTALGQIAIGDAHPAVRAQAAATLAKGGSLTDPVVTALDQIATGATDPAVRVRAAAALANGGSPTEPVVTALVQIATGATKPHVRLQAAAALAESGSLTEPVVTALGQIATGDADPAVQVRAAATLAKGGPLTEPVLTALRQIATGDADQYVRVQAAALAKGGSLTEPVITALVQIATGDADRTVRMRATAALAEGESLAEPAITALVQIATGDAHPAVRVRAVAALARGKSLTEPVISTAVQLVHHSDSWTTRRDIVRQLRHASPTKDVVDALMSLFLDSYDDVRREVGRTLVEVSRRHPDHVIDIRSRLAIACTNPALGEANGDGSRTAWDYACEALRSQVELSE